MARDLQFENLGSLITVGDRCLGNLWHAEGHGVYEPSLGRVDIDPQYVDPHNEALDQALIDGLDNCQVGQRGFFYFNRHEGTVKTFSGKLVSTQVSLSSGGCAITFRRNGKKFRGRLSQQADSFNFRRIA